MTVPEVNTSPARARTRAISGPRIRPQRAARANRDRWTPPTQLQGCWGPAKQCQQQARRARSHSNARLRTGTGTGGVNAGTGSGTDMVYLQAAERDMKGARVAIHGTGLRSCGKCHAATGAPMAVRAAARVVGRPL